MSDSSLPIHFRVYVLCYDSADSYTFIAHKERVFTDGYLSDVSRHYFGHAVLYREMPDRVLYYRVYYDEESFDALANFVQDNNELLFSAPVQSQIRLSRLVDDYVIQLLNLNNKFFNE